MNKFFLVVLSALFLAGCSKGPEEKHGVKATVTGIAGFTLGETLPETLGDAMVHTNENGSVDCSWYNFTNLPPFDQLEISADEHRIIYQIILRSSSLADRLDQRNILINDLDEKYGLTSPRDDDKYLMFGHDPHRIALMTSRTIVSLYYEDAPTLSRLRESERSTAQTNFKKF